MPTLEETVQSWHNAQPHPLSPNLTVGEYSTAARMATMLKFGQGSTQPSEVANFWKEFQQMNQTLLAQKKAPFSPEEFIEHTQQLAKVSFAYHGRPPSMREISRLKDAHPKDVSDYFGALPDEHYPHVSAANMVKNLQAARPWAQTYLQRDPNKLEASYFHHSGHSPQDYYSQMKNNNGTQNQP